MRPLIAMAIADLQERTRRYSFLVTLVFAVYIGYGVATGLIQMHLGKDARGVFNSAWIGATMTACATTFLALVGFHVVKNTVERDRQTGVGQILATTPVTRVQYTLGKTASNFLVLLSLLAVLAAAGFVMQMWRGEERAFDPIAFFAPMFWVALPALLLVAALAVFFETTPGLSGGFGNVAYFFLWAGLITVSAAGSRQLDPSGFHLLASSMRDAAIAGIPGYDGGIGLTVNPGQPIYEKTVVWNGIAWTPAVMWSRLPIVAAGIAVALLAAVPFDRFDTTRRLLPSRKKRKGGATDAAITRVAASLAHVSLPAVAFRPGLIALTLAELRLLLRSVGWRWWLVTAGLLVAQILTPLSVSRGPILFASWLWPLLLWSAMGCRERRFGTGELVFTGAGILPRQFAAIYVAGLVVALLAGFGAGARSLLAGDLLGVAAFAAGAAFIPALALACGAWSGSSKLFEALYTILWYVGPLNRVPALDYTGTHAPSPSRAFAYVLVAAALLAVAFLGRIHASRKVHR